MRRIRTLTVLAVVALMAALIATSAFAATKSVGVKGLKWSTSSVSIKKGDTVRWKWSGAVPHDVRGPGFKSTLKPKLTYSHKFARAGTFTVYCAPHRAVGMTMKVRVR